MNLTDLGVPLLRFALRHTLRFADYLDRWVDTLDVRADVEHTGDYAWIERQ